MNRGTKMVEGRWGYPFWQVVRDFAEQGLDRAKVSRALGINYNHLGVLLNQWPEHDPFPPSNRQIAYLQDTGQPFREAVAELDNRGVGVGQAARLLGFSTGSSLRRHLESRGLLGLFVKVDPFKDYCDRNGQSPLEAIQHLHSLGLKKTAATLALGLTRTNQIQPILAQLGLPSNYFDREPKRTRGGGDRKPGSGHPWRGAMAK